MKEIEAGTADFAVVDDLPPGQLARLAARYGPSSPAARAGGQRYFVNSLLGFVNLDLNTSRPLFANADLRKAVNYALDRRAIARAYRPLASRPTSTSSRPSRASATPTSIRSAPDLAEARRLARGHGGHAVLYACAAPACREVAHLIQSRACADRDQRRDQVEVELLRDLQPHRISARAVRHGPRRLVPRLPRPLRHPELPLRRPLDQSQVDNSNHSYFDDPVYNRKLAAAARLTGPRRYAAYQALEADLLRNAAPSAPLFNSPKQTSSPPASAVRSSSPSTRSTSPRCASRSSR